MPVPPFLPPQLPWVFDVLVGQQWPQADEDAVRRVAQAWTDALGQLVAIADGGNSAAQRVGYSVQSISSDQFDQYWSQYTNGNDSAVGQMAQQCQALAEMLLQEAEQVEFTKLSIDIQIVILAIQLIYDIAMAIPSAGASMGEASAATMAGRLTVGKILGELLKGALMAAAPDFITQVIMLAEGHRSSFNIGETLQAAGSGALGAAVGMGVGHLTGGIAGSLVKGLAGDTADTLGAKLTTGLVHTVNAGVTGALTNMGTTALTDAVSGQGFDNVLSAGLSGAGTGLLFHGTHAAGEAIGDSLHSSPEPEPTPNPRPAFTTDQGTQLQGVQTGDNTYALFDQAGAQHGAGTYDPTSGQLDVTPVQGDPYSTHATIDNPTTDLNQAVNEPVVSQPQTTDTSPYTTHDASLASFDPVQNPEQPVFEHAPGNLEATPVHETTVLDPQTQIETGPGPQYSNVPVTEPLSEAPPAAQEPGFVNQEANAGPAAVITSDLFAQNGGNGSSDGAQLEAVREQGIQAAQNSDARATEDQQAVASLALPTEFSAGDPVKPIEPPATLPTAEQNSDTLPAPEQHDPRPFQSGGGYDDQSVPPEPPVSPISSEQEAQLAAILMNEYRGGAAAMVDRLRSAIAVMAGIDPTQLDQLARLEPTFHQNRLNSGIVPADVPVDDLIAEGNTRELLASFIGAAFESQQPYCFDRLVLDLAHAGDMERLGAAGLDVKALHDYIDFLQRRLNHWPEPKDFTNPGNLADFFSPGSDTASDLRDDTRRIFRADKFAPENLLPLDELDMHRIGLSSREITDLLARAQKDPAISERLKARLAPFSTGESTFVPATREMQSSWYRRNTVEGDMPAVAGPSGTTTRAFAVAKFLRPPPEMADDFAAALAGYLVSSHHHSMSEVVQGLDALHYYDTPASHENIAKTLNLDNLYGKVPGLVRHEPTALVSDPAHPGMLVEQVQHFLHQTEARPPDLLDTAEQLHWSQRTYAELGQNRDAVVNAVVRVLDDVPRPNGELGYSTEEVSAVHSYLFTEEHELDDGFGGTVRAPFDADPEIAAAWQRMASGVIDARDLVLMEHELAEMDYFRQHPGASLLEAHRAANEVANWEQTLPDERRQALYDYVRNGNGDPGVLPKGGGGSGDDQLSLGGQPGPAGPGTGSGQGDLAAATGGGRTDDPVPGGGQEGVRPQGEQQPLAGAGDDSQLKRPFQSGGHYRGSESEPEAEPVVRNTIMEALNGHPPAVDHPATIASVTPEGDHLLLELTDGSRTTWARLDATDSGLVVSTLDENGEILRRMAATVGPEQGVFNVFAHADPNGIVVDGMHLPFAQLADRVAGLPREIPIRLYGCDAGAAEAAAELASVSGHDVIAADTPVWLDRNGNVIAASQVDTPAGPRPKLVDDGSGNLTGDGAWKLFHPDGSVSRLTADDPLHPVGHLASPDEELLRLAPAKKPGIYGFFEDPFYKPAVPDISDVAGRFSLEEVPLRNNTENPQPPRNLNRALQKFAAQEFEDLRNDPRYEAILAARRQGGIRTSEPVQYEAAVREANASLPEADRLANRQQDRLELAGIKVTDTWVSENASSIQMESGQGAKGYVDLLGRVGKARDLFVRQTGSTPEMFDKEFAAAVVQLATHPDEPAGRKDLESLVKRIWPGTFRAFPPEPDPADDAAVARWRQEADAWNAIQAQGDRAGPASVAFMHMGAQIADLSFSTEGGRHPENLYTNLMAWDLVKDGVMPLEYAFREGNAMGPNSAARITAIADWENADRADPRPRVKQLNLRAAALGPDGVPTQPRSIYANVDEFQRREVEVLARYALHFGGIVGTGDGGAVTVDDLSSYFHSREPEVAVKELVGILYRSLGM